KIKKKNRSGEFLIHLNPTHIRNAVKVNLSSSRHENPDVLNWSTSGFSLSYAVFEFNLQFIFDWKYFVLSHFLLPTCLLKKAGLSPFFRTNPHGPYSIPLFHLHIKLAKLHFHPSHVSKCIFSGPIQSANNAVLPSYSLFLNDQDRSLIFALIAFLFSSVRIPTQEAWTEDDTLSYDCLQIEKTPGLNV